MQRFIDISTTCAIGAPRRTPGPRAALRCGHRPARQSDRHGRRTTARPPDGSAASSATAAVPAALQLAEAAVAVAVGLSGPVLLPQQHQRDARPAQLAMKNEPNPAPACVGFQALRRRARTATRQTGAERDRPIAQPLGLEPQDLSHAAHRRSLGWHPLPFLAGGEPMRFNQPSRVGRFPIGTGGRLGSELAAGFKPESVAEFIPESLAGFIRNQQTPYPSRSAGS